MLISVDNIIENNYADEGQLNLNIMDAGFKFKLHIRLVSLKKNHG